MIKNEEQTLEREQTNPVVNAVMLLITAPLTIPIAALSILLILSAMSVPIIAVLTAGVAGAISLIMSIVTFATDGGSVLPLAGVVAISIPITTLGAIYIPKTYKKIISYFKVMSAKAKWSDTNSIFKAFGSICICGGISMLAVLTAFMVVVTAIQLGFTDFMFMSDIAIALAVLGFTMIILAITLVLYHFSSKLIKSEYTKIMS